MPFSSPKSIFVHPVKTGGTWVETQLEAEGEMKRLTQYNQHTALRYLRLPNLAGREVVISARSPHSWYGSLYLHAKRLPSISTGLLVYAKGKDDDFKAVLHGMTHITEETTPRSPVLISGDCLDHREALLTSGMGLYSFYFLLVGTIDGQWIPSRILNQESLSQDFDAWRGTQTSKVGLINAHPGPPADYLSWYDEEMLGWVKEADSRVAKILGYDLGRCL